MASLTKDELDSKFVCNITVCANKKLDFSQTILLKALTKLC